MLSIVQKIVPSVNEIVKVVDEAQGALKAGQEFAEEVEKPLEGDHPFRTKAQAMIKEFKDVDTAIRDVTGR